MLLPGFTRKKSGGGGTLINSATAGSGPPLWLRHG